MAMLFGKFRKTEVHSITGMLLTTIFLICACEPTHGGAKSKEESEPAAQLTYERAAKNCKPFPYRAKYKNKSFPNLEAFNNMRAPKRGDDQFEYLKKQEGYEKKTADISAGTYCDDFETVFPEYDQSTGAFELELVNYLRPGNNEITPGQILGGETSFASEPLIDIRVKDYFEYKSKSFKVTTAQGAAIDKEKKRLFRRSSSDLYNDRFRVPIRVVYKLLPKDDWRPEYADGSGQKVPTINVIFWDSPDFENLVKRHASIAE